MLVIYVDSRLNRRSGGEGRELSSTPVWGQFYALFSAPCIEKSLTQYRITVATKEAGAPAAGTQEEGTGTPSAATPASGTLEARTRAAGTQEEGTTAAGTQEAGTTSAMS
jgi:hypothetical protein